MKINTNEKQKVIGEYIGVSLAPWVQRGSAIHESLREASRTKSHAAREMILAGLREMGAIQEVKFVRNIIPTSGRNVLARILAGDTTYSGEVDWGALGDGTSAFNNASTTLNNELYRSQADSQAFDDNIAYIDWFIAAGDVADQTFEEFGAFIDGTGSADSGQAWSLLITGGWVKSGSMFISAKYTFV